MKSFFSVRSLFSPTRNVISLSTYQYLQKTFRDCKSILNVGASSATVLGAKFWSIVPNDSTLTTLDIDQSSGADLICDVISIPVSDNTFDLVVCQASAEHFENLDLALKEIKRVTKSQRYLYFTVPFLQGYHADPNDFRRFTSQGFINEMNLTCIDHGVSSGPFSVISWILRDLFTFGNRGSLLYQLTRLSSSFIFVPISYLDFVFPRINSYSRNACEYYYLFIND